MRIGESEGDKLLTFTLMCYRTFLFCGSLFMRLLLRLFPPCSRFLCISFSQAVVAMVTHINSYGRQINALLITTYSTAPGLSLCLFLCVCLCECNLFDLYLCLASYLKLMFGSSMFLNAAFQLVYTHTHTH